MTQTVSTYRKDIDALKGFAIVTVVLYHMGLLSTGYLGVDVFFVINGFFILPKALKIENWGGYLSFIHRRVMRLLPMILLASFVCLLVGYSGMLPDDYENLCESIIAANLFSTNILSSLTVKNYWDVWNEYKPLMHTWYLGILVEFYVIFPLLVLLTKYICNLVKRDYTKVVMPFLYALAALSFSLFIMPNIPFSDKFYMLPFRLFELLAGGIMAMKLKTPIDISRKLTNWAFIFLIGILLLVLSGFWGWNINDYNEMLKLAILVIVVLLTSMLLLSYPPENDLYNTIMSQGIIIWVGKMSLSIYIWHQIVLAFYRYFVTNDLSLTSFVILWIVTIGLSVITYYFVEKKVKATKGATIACLVFFFVITIPAFYLYLHAGVVRDVPELDINKENVHRNMFKDYSDRIYKNDKNFERNDKINVFIIGNSFARDWANVLMESKWKDSIEISYVHNDDEYLIEKIKERAGIADVIFVHGSKDGAPKEIWTYKRKDINVWGIGTKNYGESNGFIYVQRNDADYFNLTVDCDPKTLELNNQLHSEWKDFYIDIISCSKETDGKIRVFTPNHKFISMDTRHLTRAGCKYYASIMDLDKYFRIKR